MTFFGTFPAKSVLMALIPVVVLGVVGVKNEYSMSIHSYGLVAVLGSLLYCIMEEYGWRGYLEEEVKGIKPIFRYVLVGFIWYSWHLSFLTEASVQENLFFLGMLILGSWGIGQVAEATKSILACACFHLGVQIMMFNSLIKNGLDGTQKLVILAVCVGLWILVLRRKAV